MADIQTIIPRNNMDLDSDDRVLKPGDFRETLNMDLISPENEFSNVVSNHKGNLLVPFTQPNGNNIVLNSYQVVADNSMIYFVYNDLGYHQIRRFYRDTGIINVIAESGLFNWLPQSINFVDFVDDKLLYWTDTKCRKLNIQKSDNNNKIKQSNIYVLNGSFTVTVTLPSSGTTTELFLTGSTVDQVLAQLQANALMTAGLSFVKCNGYIEVAQLTPNNGYEIASTLGSGGIVVPQNYFYSIVEETFSAEKDPFNGIPSIDLMNNPNVTYNNLNQRNQQFRVSYIYDDFEYSVLSPASDMVVNQYGIGYNFVRVGFTDNRLNNANLTALINNIQLYIRNGNAGNWLLVKKLPQSEFWQLGTVGQNTFDFYNDGFYPQVDIQTATTLFDVIPISPIDSKYTIAETIFEDRIGYAKFRENYNQACNNAKIIAEFTPTKEERVFNIGLIIRIASDQQFTGAFLDNDFYLPPYRNESPGGPNNFGMLALQNDFNSGNIGAIYNTGSTGSPPLPTLSLWGGASDNGVATDDALKNNQVIPENGWPVYLAGTQYFTISKQERIANLIYNPDGSLDASSPSAKDAIKAWYQAFDSQTQVGDMISTATLTGIPAGEYIIRLGSHRCSFGDKANAGAIYDLNNGLAYQKTSTNVWGWYDSIGVGYNQMGDYEVKILIRPDGSYEISSPIYGISRTGAPTANNNIFIGDVIVRDLVKLHDKQDPDKGALLMEGNSITGYLYDTFTAPNTTELTKGIAIEGQLVQLYLGPFWTGVNPASIPIDDYDYFLWSCITDHNGYFYFARCADRPMVRVISAKKRIIKTFRDAFHIGTLSALFDGTATLNTEYNSSAGINYPVFHTTGSHTTDALLTISDYQFHTDYQTLISGSLTDGNGNALPSVFVAYQRNGRTAISDSNGQFGIEAYALCYTGDLSTLLYRSGSMVVNWIDFWHFITLSIIPPSSAVARQFDYIVANTGTAYFLFPSVSILIEIVNFITNYNITIPYAATNINPIVLALTTAYFAKYLKTGCNYNIGICEVDTLGRRYDLIDMGVLYIPFWTENVQKCTFNGVPFAGLPNQQAIGVFNFTLDLTDMVPQSWANKLFIYRTPNETQVSELQFPAYDVKYVISYTPAQAATASTPATDLAIQETTYETRTANRIWIGIPQAINNYNRFQSGSLVAWTWSEGDRIRIRNTANGVFVSGFIDVPILGVSPDGLYFVVLNEFDFPKLEAGALFEVYTPRLTTSDDSVKVFYQIPIEANVVSGQFSPQIIPLNTGDTYRRNRIVPIKNGINSGFIEDNSVSDFYPSKVDDAGLPLAQTGFSKEILQTNLIRWSEKYFPDTKINGLSSFIPENQASTSRDFGTITWIGMTNDDQYQQVMLVVHENQPVTYYVGVAILSDVNGQLQTVLTDKVLSTYRVLKSDYGSVNPESFNGKDGTIFYYCAERKAIVRYSANGITNISDQGIRSDLRNYIGNSQGYEAIGGFDAYRMQYVLTFTIAGNPKTYVYTESPYEEKRGWHGFRSYIPECYGAIGENLYAFLHGQLWIQEANAIRGNFFGVQYPMLITMVANKAPEIMKQGQHLTILSKGLWSVPSIRNRYGQETRINNIELTGPKGIQNVLKGNFNLDINTPNIANPLYDGQGIYSEIFTITLRNDNTDLVTLYGIQVGAVEAPPTGK